MKYRLLISLLLVCSICFGQFPIGANPGYYGSQYTDQQIYALMSAAGCSFTRSTVDIKSAQTYGYQTFTARIAYMYNTLGFRNNVLFADANPYNGTYTGQSTKTTAGGNRSWMPSGLFLNPFNPDSSINQSNIAAVYFDSLLVNYGAYFSYFQVWNEPDFSYTADAYLDSTKSATSWQKTEPTPDELPNMYDSLEDYVQLCKIARQVCNHVKPSMKVITGGLGYTWFYMWCLRKGIASGVNGIDYHEYPFYQWTFCNWNGTACGSGGAMRNSDEAAHLVDSAMQMYRFIETQEGATHIPMSSTEIALPRWSFPLNTSSAAFPNNKNFGSNDCQQNFIIKSVILLMRDTLSFYTMYQTGEGASYQNASSGNPFVAMGLDTNMTTAGGVGHEMKTPQGNSYTAMQNLLKHYTINYTPPTLATGTNGAELDSATYKFYVVWAICQHDTVESGAGTFALPAGQTYTEFDRNGNLISGSVTGTVSINGAPVFLRQNTTGNVPPTVSAGSNQNLTATSGTLTGTASAGSGTITSETWTQISGPNTAVITTPSSLTTTITGLITGTYVFQLSVTNSNSLTTTSRVTITVAIAPVAPTAVITPSQTSVQLPLDSVSLNGAASHDNNTAGSIASYAWTQISGPTSTIRLPSAVTTNVIMPTAGTYIYQLIVTNTGGVKSAATMVSISVIPATLLPLTAVITTGSPTNIIQLSTTALGLFATGSIEPNANSGINQWSWQLLTVPAGSSATIQAPTQNATQLLGVIAGSYTIKLTIWDTNGLTASTTVQITVNSNMLLVNKIVKQVN
jgi:hypothetical protein